MKPVLVILMFALAACDRPVETKVVEVAQPTMAASFVYLVSHPDQRIHFRVTAPKSRALYLENCNGAISWGLERKSAAAWVPAWGAEIDGCHSAPIEIPAGTHRDFHEVVALRPSEPLLRGAHRVAVYGLYFNHDSNDHPIDSEVPHALRLSQPFELVVSATR